MPERLPKIVLVAVTVLAPLILAFLAYSRPEYFTQRYLGGLLGLEVLAVALWMYRRVYFPLVIVVFLLAGMDLPGRAIWTAGRWGVLGVGAMAGLILAFKGRRYHFGLFDLMALLSVLAALASAAVSRYTSLSLLKVLSLFLLYLYAATGARFAVMGRENRFFAGLLTGCELFVGAIAASHFLGYQVMGNPNSLGAVMGVVGAPILLWGILVSEKPIDHHRRLGLFVIAVYVTFASHARAGMLAALLTCGLLCLALRRYKLFMQGITIVFILGAASAILQPEAFSKTVSAVTSAVVYKGKDPAHGILDSRHSPWQDAVDSINSHFWFGSGFGTADNGKDTADSGGRNRFATQMTETTEHGSSYLAVATWVGMAGMLPFLMLVIILLRKIFQTVVWTFRTANPYHPAIPLALVMVAGLIHAGFEDWLFAPGYYLCVFLWSLAFVFVNVAPLPVPANVRPAVLWRTGPIPQGLTNAAPSR